MKQILLLAAILSLMLSSCTTSYRSIDRLMGQINMTEQVYDAYARRYHYYKEQLPWKNTPNGTDVRYTWNKSTTKKLTWYDTEVRNEGAYVLVYNTQAGRLVGRLSKNVTTKKTFPVRVYSPYDDEILYMTLEITVIARTATMLGNVIIRLNQGNVTIESYSMR